jgi:DHA1 family bicyclomycin/chloramphenicol resistance-like MFS transporter
MGTVPRIAGTASGASVFVQYFCGAVFAQLYGMVADGTPKPMILITALGSFLCLAAGALPFFLARRASKKVEM